MQIINTVFHRLFLLYTGIIFVAIVQCFQLATFLIVRLYYTEVKTLDCILGTQGNLVAFLDLDFAVGKQVGVFLFFLFPLRKSLRLFLLLGKMGLETVCLLLQSVVVLFCLFLGFSVVLLGFFNLLLLGPLKACSIWLDAIHKLSD